MNNENKGVFEGRKMNILNEAQELFKELLVL